MNKYYIYIYTTYMYIYIYIRHIYIYICIMYTIYHMVMQTNTLNLPMTFIQIC